MTTYGSIYAPLVGLEGTGNLAYGRLKPNLDLVEGLKELFIASGYRSGLLRGGLGSLNRAHLLDPDGKRKTIEGPGLEIVSVCGVMRRRGGDADVDVWAAVADAAGRVHEGKVVPQINYICITFDAAIEELRDVVG